MVVHCIRIDHTVQHGDVQVKGSYTQTCFLCAINSLINYCFRTAGRFFCFCQVQHNNQSRTDVTAQHNHGRPRGCLCVLPPCFAFSCHFFYSKMPICMNMSLHGWLSCPGCTPSCAQSQMELALASLRPVTYNAG